MKVIIIICATIYSLIFLDVIIGLIKLKSMRKKHYNNIKTIKDICNDVDKIRIDISSMHE